MRCTLLIVLAFLIVLQTGNAETVDARIVESDFPTGDWYRGSNQGGANVALENIGDVGNLFWIKYSVMDSRGAWWDAPLESVYLEPGEETDGMICMVWPIPDDVALGSCQAQFTIWGGYDSDADSVYNLLDNINEADAFRIIE